MQTRGSAYLQILCYTTWSLRHFFRFISEFTEAFTTTKKYLGRGGPNGQYLMTGFGSPSPPPPQPILTFNLCLNTASKQSTSRIPLRELKAQWNQIFKISGYNFMYCNLELMIKTMLLYSSQKIYQKTGVQDIIVHICKVRWTDF